MDGTSLDIDDNLFGNSNFTNFSVNCQSSVQCYSRLSHRICKLLYFCPLGASFHVKGSSLPRLNRNQFQEWVDDLMMRCVYDMTLEIRLFHLLLSLYFSWLILSLQLPLIIIKTFITFLTIFLHSVTSVTGGCVFIFVLLTHSLTLLLSLFCVSLWFYVSICFDDHGLVLHHCSWPSRIASGKRNLLVNHFRDPANKQINSQITEQLTSETGIVSSTLWTTTKNILCRAVIFSVIEFFERRGHHKDNGRPSSVCINKPWPSFSIQGWRDEDGKVSRSSRVSSLLKSFPWVVITIISFCERAYFAIKTQQNNFQKTFVKANKSVFIVKFITYTFSQKTKSTHRSHIP